MFRSVFITIDYDEDNPTDYKGVGLTIDRKDPEIFFSEDPSRDYWTAHMVARTRIGPNIPITNSSSIGHFVTDGGGINLAPSDELVDEWRDVVDEYLAGTGELEALDEKWLGIWKGMRDTAMENKNEAEAETWRIQGRQKRVVGNITLPSRNELYKFAMERSEELKNGGGDDY